MKIALGTGFLLASAIFGQCTNGNLPLTNQTLSGTYAATGTITADSAGGTTTVPSGAGVVFQAGTSIVLLPNFHAASGSSFTASIGNCTPPTLTSVGVSPSTVNSGTNATLTVNLNSPAPYGGASVALSASPSSAFPVPSNLTVLAGQTSASTQVTAGSVSSATNVTVTGTYSGTQYAYLTVDPSGSAPTTTITSSPTGLSILVNGVACTTPCSYQWTSGSNESISATIAQSANGSPYLFTYWSDGWPASHSITVPSSSTTYTAYFNPRVSVSGGISPSALEVNLGFVGFDYYDGTTPNSAAVDNFASCTSYIPIANPIYQACMQYLLSNYAIQGVTDVRFQFSTMANPSSAPSGSTALTGPGSVSSAWETHVSNFFSDLAAFGITNITPQPSWDNGSAAYYPASGPPTPTCQPLLNQTSCTAMPQFQCTTQSGQNGSLVAFSPLLPYGVNVVQNGSQYSFPTDNYADNQAYACSPANPNFWGWGSHFELLWHMASLGRTAGLNFEEFDLWNEVDLLNFTVEARMVYDNTTFTPVLGYLGNALTENGYNAGAVTVSVVTGSPADISDSQDYPCESVYGDAAQVLGSSELLAAVGGYQVGFPEPPYLQNGTMLCGGVPNADNNNPSDPYMVYIPSQGTAPPTVVDMHAKPCMQLNFACDQSSDDINTPANQIQAAQDTWSMAWDFVYYRYPYTGLAQPLTMFGETWSNSVNGCNGLNDTTLTQQTVTGYQQSCLSGQNANCFVDGATTQAGVNPKPASVVFRPWGDANSAYSQCETPLNIGAPTPGVTSGGPFKQ